MIRDFHARLTNKINLTGEVWQFTFEIEGEPLHFTAGQYVLLKIGTAFRQYSISSSPTDGSRIEFLIEFFPGGLASTYLAGLSVGDVAEFKGPAGVFTLKETPTPKMFLATGTGIAPVKSMIAYALERGYGSSLNLFFGLKTRDDMYALDEFEALHKANSHFDYTYCLSREKSLDGLPEHVALGRVTNVLDTYFETTHANRADFEYYLCGSKEVVQSLKEYSRERGVPQENTFSEMFG